MNVDIQMPPELQQAASNDDARDSRWVALLVIIFFAALLPTLPDLSRYHGDERFYTDAGITMLQTGDYLTPRYADGAERFKKPLLTYWVLCASYKILGISVFSSRLPFLLAGCGVIWLTWRLGRTLFGARDPALLGVVVIAANVQTMTIATRSTPDILLCFFVAASLCGFAELLLRQSRAWKSYALAYLGAGLACATKGLWGLLPLLFAFLFWRFATHPRLPLLQLARAGWLLGGAVIGLSWFVVAAIFHGSSSLEIFLKDQTTASAELAKWFFISNVADYAWATLRHFEPWLLIAAGAALTRWQSFKEFLRPNRDALRFAIGWYALVFVIFSFGLVLRTRYLLPTYPCLAVALGAFLATLAHQTWLRRIIQATLSIGIALGCLTAIVGWRLDWRASAGGALLALVAVVLIKFSKRTEPTSPMMVLAMFLIITFSIVMVAWRPIFGINPTAALARRLSQPEFAGRPLAGLGIPPVIASQLRLVSAGHLNPKIIPSWPADIPPSAVLLVSENNRDQLTSAGYTLTPAPFRTKRLRLKDIAKAFRTGHLESSFESARQNYYIALRP